MGTTAYQPLVLVETSELPREEWLAYRRRGIGGSDAAAVLGISPFMTGRDLYYDKLGISAAADDENWVAKEIGHRLEPLVAEIFSKRTGLKVFQKKFMFQHPQYPWMLADLDYLVELPDGSIAILECKTSTSNSSENWWYAGKEIVPAYYESQGRHYIGQRPHRQLAGAVGGHIGIAGGIVAAHIELAPRGGPLPIYHGGRPQKGPGAAVRAFDVDSFHG